jgi:peptidyl-dipeptidase Dcp
LIYLKLSLPICRHFKKQQNSSNMKTAIFSLLIVAMMFLSNYGQKNTVNNSNNPFFQEWKTPFGTPPFTEIKLEHYLPGYEEGIRQHDIEIDKIVANREVTQFQKYD